MQKKIIALAVAGLVSGAAFAQSNVTIYGTLDIGYLQGNLDTSNSTTVAATSVTTRNKADTDFRSTGMQDGSLSSNRIGLRGSEDLGNGLTAMFNVEMGMTEADRLGADTGPDTANAFTFRKQNIGLKSGFGTVTIGRQDVLIDDAWNVGSAGMKNNAYGDMYSTATAGGNTVSLAGTFHDIRANELMTYVSPNFSGFTVSAQYGTGKTEADGNTTVSNVVGEAFADSNADHTNWGLRADYANGPVAVVFAYNSEENDAYTGTGVTGAPIAGGNSTEKNSWLLGANYNFGIVKVFGQYYDGERNQNLASATAPALGLLNKSNADISGWELGVHIPLGAITLAGTYFNTDFDTDAYTTANATNTIGTKQSGNGDGEGYQLAALYSLSKRTTAYFMYGHEDSNWSARNVNTATNVLISTQKADADLDHFAIGVRHTF